MQKDTVSIKELIIIVALLTVFFILLNPFGWWMPDMMLAGLLIIALVIFGLFAAFAVKEKVRDERESHHRFVAGRSAFIAGTSVLALAMLIQSLHHNVDPWLFVAFVTMILVKLGSRSYADQNY
ncbi:MAG TPA: hypothetical protein VL576_00555 [Candidatus Paceibacterota bacterium]|jgi:hypothetical protein|nr:hypothetical protein [Candidatus Paceibacterota bacterium]